MNGWITAAEKALSDLSAQTGIPFDFERFEGELSQLPDKFIVYFLVSNPPKTHYDGAESSSTARAQVSFYYRQKSDILEMPDKIIDAFSAAGFMRAGEGRIPYQKDTGHYGWRCDFNYYEKR